MVNNLVGQISESHREFMRNVAEFGFKVSTDVQWLPDKGFHGMDKPEALNPTTLQRRAREEIDRLVEGLLPPDLKSKGYVLTRRVWYILGAELTMISDGIIPNSVSPDRLTWKDPQLFPEVFRDETDMIFVIREDLPQIREHMFPILAGLEECDTCYALLDILPRNLEELPPNKREVTSLQRELAQQANRINLYENVQNMLREVFGR